MFPVSRAHRQPFWLLLAILSLLLLVPAALADNVVDSAVATPEHLVLTLETPPWAVRTAEDGDSLIVIDGFSPLGTPDAPQLPGKLIDVALPPDADPATLTVAVAAERVTDLPGTHQIAPAPPVATWDEGRRIVAWGEDAPTLIDGGYSAIYGADAFYPEQPVSLLTTGHLRQWQVARLVYSPVQYNPVTGQLRVTTSLSLTITFDRLPAASLAESTPAADTVFDALAVERFVNFAEAQAWYGANTAAPATAPGYVVITTNQIARNSAKLTAFLAHKATQGFQTWLVTQSDFNGLTGQAPNGRAEKIRQWLKNNYVGKNIQYVLLIGNPDPDEGFETDIVGDLPMKMLYPRSLEDEYRESASDYFYADLTGNWDLDGDQSYGEYYGDNGAGGVDFMPEVIVGRIPVYTSEPDWVATLDTILQKTIDYELAGSAAWQRKALLPMAFTDWATDGAYLAERMKTDFLNSRGFTAYTLYEQGTNDPEYDSVFTSDEELVWPAVRNHWQNNPYGLVVWWTHGNTTIAEKVIQSSEVIYLDDSRPALVYEGACGNGHPRWPYNLGNALLGQGAVGTVSATSVIWYTPGPFQLRFNCADSSTLTYRYADLIAAGKTAGQALYQMKSEMGTCYEGASWMNLDALNLYGDPAIRLAGGDAPDEGLNEVYVSAAKSGTVAGLPFTGADILHYTRAGNTWAMLFDASDVGLNANVSAFSFLPDGSILLALAVNANVPGVGAVTPMDIIHFVPTQLGNTTAGTFQWYFDGSDVGLTTTAEKIDALSFFQTAAGSQRLRISTTGTARVSGSDGGTLVAHDEDILLFVIDALGATTAGNWSTALHLDGTLIPGLAVEDVIGYAGDGVTNNKYVLISGAFNVAGVAGNGKSVLKLTPDSVAPGGHQVALAAWLASGDNFPVNLDGLEIIR